MLRMLSILIYFLFSFQIQAQDNETEQANRQLDERGEVYFVFTSGRDSVEFFSKIISIDIYREDSVFAYANKDQFSKFLPLNIPFKTLTPPSLVLKKRGLKSTSAEWDYPSYTDYVAKMERFAAENPSLCKLYDFGTTPGGRKLLAVKLSDDAGSDEEEPNVFYTAAIHGDEGGSMVLMLKLIGYLLSEYGNDEVITGLLDNVQVYINPLSNPDGFYFLSDHSNAGATRFNSNHIDLNRNFPDPEDGEHPDGYDRQPENVAMMDFMQEHHFILSANFHEGAEVVNYPWDTWSKLHADNEWFMQISEEYADTIHQYSNDDYFTFMNNGITNGYEWYTISGGRQDYTTFFLHGREVTIELSDEKAPPAEVLQTLWERNKASFIYYLMNGLEGVRGQVTDAETGRALQARVFVVDHDTDSSFVYASENGFYYRLISPGSYTFSFDCPGYEPAEYEITVPQSGRVEFNASLLPVEKEPFILINPVKDNLIFSVPDTLHEKATVEIFDLTGKLAFKSEIMIQSQKEVVMDVRTVHSGFYILRISAGSFVKKYRIVKE